MKRNDTYNIQLRIECLERKGAPQSKVEVCISDSFPKRLQICLTLEEKLPAKRLAQHKAIPTHISKRRYLGYRLAKG